MHRLATIHNITDDRRNSVPIARPLVRSAKKMGSVWTMDEPAHENASGWGQ